MLALMRACKPQFRQVLAPALRQATILMGGMAAIIIVVAGGIAVDKYLYDCQVEEASNGLRNLSFVVSDHANRSMQAVELSVSSIVKRLQAHKLRTVKELEDFVETPELQEFLDNVVAENPFIERVFVIGADGKLDPRSRSGGMPPDFTARSEYMTELEQSKPDAFTLSNPFQHETLHSWMINFSKRVSAPDGRFLGAVAGIVKLSSFNNLFDKLILGSHGSISTFREDGKLVSWAPRSEVPFGNTIEQTGLFRDFILSRQVGVSREPGLDDKTSRLFAVSYTANYPLAAVVAMALPDVFAAGKGQARILSVSIGLTAILIAIGTIKLAYRIDKVAQERQRLILEHQLAEQARILSNAINNLTHGVAMFNRSDRLMVWNRRYEQMFGFPEGLLRPGMHRSELLDDFLRGPRPIQTSERYPRTPGGR